jgi:hypothetical protein
MSDYTREQIDAANAAWESIVKPYSTSEGVKRVTPETFGITRTSYVSEWLRGVYGD